MIALYIAAASIVAVAVALLVARTPAKLRTADQRGITLQTLIVTAVLVLMAGAAGVVIIAITNNAQDNLEGQNSGIDSRCDPWEIFDPTLDAAGRGGGQGGIDSSASGCVRVCYVRFTATTGWSAPGSGDDLDNNGGATMGDDVGLTGTKSTTSAELVHSRSSVFDNSLTAPAGANAADVTLPVNGARSVDYNGDANDEITANIPSINGVANPENYEIQVSPNQRYCRVWNYTDDQEVTEVRSD